MKLDFIELGNLTESRANMRSAKKPPDIANILPSIRKRGIIQTLLVRPNGEPGHYEVVAGRRRFHAALALASEGNAVEPLPCGILDEGDDAAAIEASMIENFARADPDEVTQWESFAKLVREGRSADDISDTFALPALAVRRILALGNLLPRIRDLYRGDRIDPATIRHLTMASKSQQKAWLALFDDPQAFVPTGHQLKSWLFGGQSISTAHALFDLDTYAGQIVADLFGEHGWFADADRFWLSQNAAIEAKRAEYLAAGWSDVVVVPATEHFQSWEHEKAQKRKGGRVYLDVRASGEVIVHEGYVTRAEARRIVRGETPDTAGKPARAEVTSTLQTYIDLHRHAAVRTALVAHPGVALRLMAAHAIGGSHLWNVRAEPQSARSDDVRESVETCPAEADFDRRRRAVLELLRFSPEQPTVIGGDGATAAFLRLLELPDPAVMEVIAIVMGETLASGGTPLEAAGLHIGVDMSRYWQADDAFFAALRDREVLGAIVAEVAGEHVASANAGESGKTLKRIVRDHLDGANGRKACENWVPRWMAFPPSAYTTRGGVGSVAAHARLAAIGAAADDPGDPGPEGDAVAEAA